MPDPQIPLPGVNTNDPTGNTSNPLATLQAVLARQPQGVGMSGPQPGQAMAPFHPSAAGMGAPQGSFQTKGEHQRASMAALQSTASAISKNVEQHQQQQMGQKIQAYTGFQTGIQTADEQIQNAQKILQQDPSNAQAQSMLTKAQQDKAQNVSNMNMMFNPATSEGKKNAKLIEKAFGLDDNNADSPERAAAIQVLKKQSQTQTQAAVPAANLPGFGTMPGSAGPTVSQAGSGLNNGAASLQSRMPTGLSMSPQTQLEAQMVKAGVAPRSATGGQDLHAKVQEAQLQMKGIDNQANRAVQLEKIASDAGHKTDELLAHLPAMGLQAEKNDDGSVKRNPDGTVKTRNLTMAELKDNPELYAKYQDQKAKIDLEVQKTLASKVRTSIAQTKAAQANQTAQAGKSPTAMLWAAKLADPKSGVTMAQVPSKERGAVLQALNSSGLQMQKPFSSDEIKRIDLADNAIKNVDEASSILQRRPDLFGPGGWGKSKFEMALAGGDPDAVKFQTAMTLANLPLIGIHGVRGKWAAEDLSKLDSNLYLKPDSMKGVLGEIRRSASDFASTAGRPDSMTGGDYKTIQGPNGPVKAKVVNGKWVDDKGNPL